MGPSHRQGHTGPPVGWVARIRPADAVLRGIADLSGFGHPSTDAEESCEAGVATGR